MKTLRNLRKRFEFFCYKHRNWGIPNLMLYIVLGTALVSIVSMVTQSNALFALLCFDKASILQGEVWRLFTYVFTDRASLSFLSLIFLYFFYMLGRYVETRMGTFRFNLFYFTGLLLMDAFAMIFCPSEPNASAYYAVNLYSQMGFYLHLSLMLAFSASNPDAQFLIFFIIPIKAWILSVIYFVTILINIASYIGYFTFPNYLFPLIGIANFLLFAGKDVLNLLPPAWRPSGSTHYRKVRTQPQKKTGTIPFPQQQATPKQEPTYTHKCTVCGRTDVSNPELEFRYCSKCNGYHCYCEDHISNHTHIE